MSEDKRDYNIMAADGITDDDYVKDFGVPPELAHTPAINEWIINNVYEQNLELEYTLAINNGKTEAQATQWAHKVADKGRRESIKHLAKVRRARGY